MSQKNSTIKLNYYLRTISGNTDLYRAKDKNKVSFMLRYNKRSGHKCCLYQTEHKLHKLTLWPSPHVTGYFWKVRDFLLPFSFPLTRKRYFRGIKTVPRVKFLRTPAFRFRVNGRNGGFFENDDALHRISIVLVFSCGRAKTIRIRQRILRKYSEVKKNTLLCQTWQSTGIFKYIFKGHCPDYAHARRTFFFSSKRLLTILSLARRP